VVDGELLFFAAFFSKAEQKPLSGRIIVFDLQIHDGADPGESVGQGPKQNAIVDLYLNRRLLSQVIHDLNTVIYCT
jgi:hypothetical protein